MTESIIEHNDAAQESIHNCQDSSDGGPGTGPSTDATWKFLWNAWKFKAARHPDNNPNSYRNGNYW